MTITCQSEVIFSLLCIFVVVAEMNIKMIIFIDPRVQDWPLMNNPINTAIILVAYFAVIKLINVVMAKREAFELKPLLIVYNLAQVLVSFYISYEVSKTANIHPTRHHKPLNLFVCFLKILIVAIESNYSMVCEPVDYSNKPLAKRVKYSL